MKRHPKTLLTALLLTAAAGSTATLAAQGPVLAAASPDAKMYPGSMCQVSGSSQSLYYSSAVIANRTASSVSVVCPIVRDNLEQGWQRIHVFVNDRHSTRDIECIARALEADGSHGASTSVQSSGTIPQMLTLGPVAAPQHGPYVLVCQLPPMEEPNQPSYISSYRVYEP